MRPPSRRARRSAAGAGPRTHRRSRAAPSARWRGVAAGACRASARGRRRARASRGRGRAAASRMLAPCPVRVASGVRMRGGGGVAAKAAAASRSTVRRAAGVISARRPAWRGGRRRWSQGPALRQGGVRRRWRPRGAGAGPGRASLEAAGRRRVRADAPRGRRRVARASKLERLPAARGATARAWSGVRVSRPGTPPECGGNLRTTASSHQARVAPRQPRPPSRGGGGAPSSRTPSACRLAAEAKGVLRGVKNTPAPGINPSRRAGAVLGPRPADKVHGTGAEKKSSLASSCPLALERLDCPRAKSLSPRCYVQQALAARHPQHRSTATAQRAAARASKEPPQLLSPKSQKNGRRRRRGRGRGRRPRAVLYVGQVRRWRRAVGDIVQQALNAKRVFVFGELLAEPNVRALKSTDQANQLRLLEIFAYGTYSDYKKEGFAYRL